MEAQSKYKTACIICIILTTRELMQEKEMAKKNSFYDELLDPHRLRQFNLFDSYE